MKANSNPEDISREINLAELSERESEVLLLLGTGFGGTEIAARLELSPRTVETSGGPRKLVKHISDESV